MSNMSRRKFLKGAGVAALAVAAAGVLAGCSADDIPSDPIPNPNPDSGSEVKNVQVQLVYWFDHKTNELGRQTVEINPAAASTGKLDTRKYALPSSIDSDRYYAKNDVLPIENGLVFVELKKIATSEMTVKVSYYKDAATGGSTDVTEAVVATGALSELSVDAKAATINTKELNIVATKGYQAVNATETIDLNSCTVRVKVQKV